MQIIARGAEAILYDEGDKIRKVRIPKKYRLSQLDFMLRKARTRREARNITRLAEIGVNVPKVAFDGDFGLLIEKIKGKTLLEILNTNNKDLKTIFKTIGEQIRKMHNYDIIHGDLAPNNIIITKDNIPYFIDFGLSYCSKSLEDKATDIFLFLKLLQSLHIKEELILAFFEGYSPTQDFINRLETIKKRMRYL